MNNTQQAMKAALTKNYVSVPPFKPKQSKGVLKTFMNRWRFEFAYNMLEPWEEGIVVTVAVATLLYSAFQLAWFMGLVTL